jgi:hypothetical protein
MSNQYGPKIVTDGLVLCLDAGNTKSYPGSGTLWTDLSGNNNNGTLTNGPTYSSANKGGIVFDGVDDYVIINNTIVNSLLSGLTFNIWARINVLAVQGLIVNFNSNSPGQGFNLRLLSNSIDMLYFTSGGNAIGRRSSTFPGINSWNNIVGLWNGSINESGFSIYLNGIRVDNSNVAIGTVSSIVNGGANLEIGRERYFAGPTSYFNGNISQASIYNRALSAAEVLQNYNATKGRYNL